MYKNIFSILTFLFLFPLLNNAQVEEKLFLEGNNYYKNENYKEAINTYLKIIDSGYESRDLYFNLGNAYYKQKEIAPAILYYEKALQLDPGNDDIQYNLQIANKLVVDKIEVLPEFILKTWLRKFTNLFSSNFWAVVSISSFILMLIFFAAYFFTSKINIKKLSFWFGILLFSISTFAFISSLKQQKNIITNNSAIIFTPSVTTKSSPDDSGTDLFLVHEGTKVNINDKVGEWIEIKLSDGNKGWVKIEDVRFI